jgi:hypothetical protein
MGELKLTTTLLPRGPAAAVVLDDEQVAVSRRGRQALPGAGRRERSQALQMLREGKTRS